MNEIASDYKQQGASLMAVGKYINGLNTSFFVQNE